jgi:hypothetical protein
MPLGMLHGGSGTQSTLSTQRTLSAQRTLRYTQAAEQQDGEAMFLLGELYMARATWPADATCSDATDATWHVPPGQQM